MTIRIARLLAAATAAAALTPGTAWAHASVLPHLHGRDALTPTAVALLALAAVVWLAVRVGARSTTSRSAD